MRKNKDVKGKKADVKRIILGSSMLMIIVAVAIAGIVFMSQVTQPVVEHEVKESQRTWNAVADTVPDGDASGFMYFMVYPHSATPWTTYASNLTNASAYEYTDNISSEMWGETPYDTAVDFVFKFRTNDTVNYNTSTSEWWSGWARVNVTIDFQLATDVSALTNMTIVEIAHSSSFCYYHAFIADSDSGIGTGFTITHGETFNVTEVRLELEY